MQQALNHFGQNVAKVRDLHGLYGSLKAATTDAIDLSDLLRAEIVLVVSALDAFVHELVLIGMLETQNALRPPSLAFGRFTISMTSVQIALAGGPASSWLEAEIRAAHGWLTFQRPDKIADAVRLISDAKMWDGVAATLAMPVGTVKAELNSIVDRRNKIAHESDLDPTSPGTRWPISDVMTKAAVDFVDRLAHAIFAVV